jgi:hypothetical protein
MSIKIMKIKLNLVHFGYSEDNNTQRVYVIYKDDIKKVSMYGFVPNVFGYTYDDCNDEQYLNISVDVDVTSVKFMEMEENGRGNINEYRSVEDYFDDPDVKLKCVQSYITPSWKSGEIGNPFELECFMELEYNGKPFEFINRYDCEDADKMYSFIPKPWYGEAFHSYAVKCHECESYDTADDYIEYAQQNHSECPIFGERYFPVAKFKKDDLAKGYDIACWFKNCSEPLIYGDNVYFGIRSKPSEISDGVRKIYEYGSVLKNVEWDWE